MIKFNTYYLTVLLFISNSIFSQKWENPELFPYVLNEKGKVFIPDSLTGDFYTLASDKMELKDMPTQFPYRTVAHFESGKLISLHVLFGETNDGLSFEDYKSIREILLLKWHYPSAQINGRRHIDDKAWIWETTDFRIEWTYKNQPQSEIKKMGWLFMYCRNQYIESY